jgi:DNA-binding transcriptional ArsR family regulator
VSVTDSDVAGELGACGAGAVLISSASRRLRRELRPLAWMVLEEIALDAVSQDGRLIARTSARRLAEGLGIDPGTAAGALRALRSKGLVVLERESGLAGRFGLAVYVIESVDGLTVVSPGMATPHMDAPHMGQRGMAKRDAVASVPAKRTTTRAAVSGHTAVSAAPEPPAKHQDVRREALGQGALDLGLGTA